MHEHTFLFQLIKTWFRYDNRPAAMSVVGTRSFFDIVDYGSSVGDIDDSIIFCDKYRGADPPARNVSMKKYDKIKKSKIHGTVILKLISRNKSYCIVILWVTTDQCGRKSAQDTFRRKSERCKKDKTDTTSRDRRRQKMTEWENVSYETKVDKHPVNGNRNWFINKKVRPEIILHPMIL